MAKLICSNCGWVQDTAARWVLCPVCECEHWIIETDVNDDEGEE